MPKRFIDKNVYEAAVDRIEYLFGEFDRVLVAFSGGKDSGVMLEIAYDYAKEHGCLDRLGMYYMDFEAQYSQTIDYISETFQRLDSIDCYWLCLPCKVNSSLDAGETWYPWNPDDRGSWLRDYPDSPYLVTVETAKEMGFSYKTDMLGRNVRVKFGEWYAKTHGKTAVLVGIRADESLHRYNAVVNRKHMYKDNRWISDIERGKATAYPLYDWTTDDVWAYYSKTGKPYNGLYDDYYRIGIPLAEMRVAHPFCFHGVDVLKHYKTLDPKMWERMVVRYGEANFAAIYGGTEAMGFNGINLPDGHTWESYYKHLMSSLTDDLRKYYEDLAKRKAAKCGKEDLPLMYRALCVAVLRNNYKSDMPSAENIKQKREHRKATAKKWKDLL